MRLHAVVLGCALPVVCAPLVARAQGYVGEENSLSVGLAYTYAPSGKLLAEPGGTEVPGQKMFIHIFNPQLDYVTPVSGLAFESDLTLMAVKVGDDHFQHFPTNGPYDDGDLHFTAVDLKAGFRYQLKPIEEVLGLAFTLAGSVPTHDYPTNGLTAPGHGLKALYLGAAVERDFGPVLPNMFFQADYSYVIRERVDVDQYTEDINRNYHEGSALLGYLLPANFLIGVGGNVRFSVDGADFDTILLDPPSIQYNHDRLLDEDVVLVGGDLGYAISEKTQVGFQARFFVYGENTRNQNLFAFFASYQLL